MENFTITISRDKAVHHFQVGEYPHHDDQRCKYRVFENGAFVASFEPDAHNLLHICQNVAELNEELLYELADQIEAQIPHASPRHINGKEDEA
jgi:hypothetical protein